MTYPLAVYWARIATRFSTCAGHGGQTSALGWRVLCPDIDVTDTEDIAAAEEVHHFKDSWNIPGLTLVPEYFRDVRLQEGLKPYLCHVKITSHRRVLACLKLSCNELRVCTDRIVRPVRPHREEWGCCLRPTGSVEDELHNLTTCPALAALCAGSLTFSGSEPAWSVHLQTVSCSR